MRLSQLFKASAAMVLVSVLSSSSPSTFVEAEEPDQDLDNEALNVFHPYSSTNLFITYDTFSSALSRSITTNSYQQDLHPTRPTLITTKEDTHLYVLVDIGDGAELLHTIEDLNSTIHKSISRSKTSIDVIIFVRFQGAFEADELESMLVRLHHFNWLVRTTISPTLTEKHTFTTAIVDERNRQRQGNNDPILLEIGVNGFYLFFCTAQDSPDRNHNIGLCTLETLSTFRYKVIQIKLSLMPKFRGFVVTYALGNFSRRVLQPLISVAIVKLTNPPGQKLILYKQCLTSSFWTLTKNIHRTVPSLKEELRQRIGRWCLFSTLIGVLLIVKVCLFMTEVSEAVSGELILTLFVMPVLSRFAQRPVRHIRRLYVAVVGDLVDPQPDLEGQDDALVNVDDRTFRAQRLTLTAKRQINWNAVVNRVFT